MNHSARNIIFLSDWRQRYRGEGTNRRKWADSSEEGAQRGRIFTVYESLGHRERKCSFLRVSVSTSKSRKWCRSLQSPVFLIVLSLSLIKFCDIAHLVEVSIKMDASCLNMCLTDNQVNLLTYVLLGKTLLSLHTIKPYRLKHHHRGYPIVFRAFS